MEGDTAERRTQLRILCFGDSLTSGYYRWGLESHPYAIRLEERLREQLPSTNIQINVDGFPADRVINGLFLSRLTGDLSKGQGYDWIIIMVRVSMNNLLCSPQSRTNFYVSLR